MSEEIDEEKKKKKEIEVIQGNGKELNISPVYDHIKMDKPENTINKEEIVIPKKKSKK